MVSQWNNNLTFKSLKEQFHGAWLYMISSGTIWIFVWKQLAYPIQSNAQSYFNFIFWTYAKTH